MADTFARMRQIAGSTAEWAANDIVLGDGEVGVERIGFGDIRIKIGNGTAKWSQLPYVANTVAAVDAQVAAASVHAATAKAEADRADEIVATIEDDLPNITTVANNIGSVNTAATNIAAVNTVASDLNEPVSEIEAVANSITNVNTVGTNIANVNTVATDIANVNLNATNIVAIQNASANADAAELSATYANARADDAASFAGYRDYKDVATLLANTTLTYTAGQTGTVQAGDVIRIRSNGLVYSVAASGATDHIAITAGGVKLYYSKKGYAQDGKNYRTGGGALRQSTSAGGWAFIADTNHSPYGWSSTTPVALSGANLVVTYDMTMADVGQFSVTADEEFTAIGLRVGASVGVSNAIIYGYAPISGRVVGGTIGIAYSTTTGNVISQTVDQANGTITVSHLGQTHTDSNGTAVVVSELGAPSAGRVTVSSQSKTGFTLQFVRNLACRIACTTATPGSEIFTVSESSVVGPVTAAWISGTNCVRVTYPSTSAAIANAVVMGSRDAVTKYIVTIDTQGATTADIFFYDISTGALITAATTSMIFYFMKAGNFPAPLPASGTLGFVQRDMVPVDFNLLNGPSANLFVSYSHPLV